MVDPDRVTVIEYKTGEDGVYEEKHLAQMRTYLEPREGPLSWQGSSRVDRLHGSGEDEEGSLTGKEGYG